MTYKRKSLRPVYVVPAAEQQEAPMIEKIANANQTARYHFSVKNTEEGQVFIAFEPIEGDVFETSGIWLAMRNSQVAHELANTLNRTVVLVGRTASTPEGIGGWSN